MKDLVVKSNKLVEAIQTLSLTETRLLQLAIIDARETETGLSPDKPLKLCANRYAEAFNVSRDAAYLALKEAEDSLFRKKFIITNDDKIITKSRWIQDATYHEGQGKILITLTRVVIEHVTRIDGFENYFTSYHLQKTSNFKSVYAVRLYELLMQWKSLKKTNIFHIDKFRLQLGLRVNEYNRIEAFKRRVLDIAITQINEYSDIDVEYTQHKEGKSITGFSFEFKFKKTASISSNEKTLKVKDEKSISLFREMTDSQRRLFSSKLSTLPDIANMAHPGEEMPDFIGRIDLMLQDPQKWSKLEPYLIKVGFK